MGVSAWTGPIVAFGASPGAGVPDYNSQQGTSLFVSGTALLDPRPPFTWQPGQADGSPVAAFLTASRIAVLDQVPSALAAANIAPSQAAVAGQALALVTASGAGITVAQTPTNQGTGVAVAAALAIDGVPARQVQGQAGTVQLWDPATLLSRNVRITSAGNDSAASFLVSGLDVYGYPMSELIVGANAGVASGRKAFKYILSVVAGAGVSGGAVSVGTGDVYGLPLLAPSFPYVELYWAGAPVTSSAGLLAPDGTSPATSSTGDVRGTYAVPSASDGTKRLVAFVTPTAANVSSIAGLFGQPQA